MQVSGVRAINRVYAKSALVGLATIVASACAAPEGPALPTGEPAFPKWRPGHPLPPSKRCRSGLGRPEDWFVGAVAWSPVGQQVVAECHEVQQHGTSSAHLWLLAPSGEAPRQLTADAAYRDERPVWMPDGWGILFHRWHAARPELAGLWTLHFDADEPRLLDAAGQRAQAMVRPGGGGR